MPFFSRARLIAPLALLAALTLTLTAVASVLAAPSGDSPSSLPLAQPQECDDIAVNAEGNLVVGDEILTDGQLGLLHADVLAALMLAASANGVGTSGVGEVCVDVGLGTAAITVTADIRFCPVMVELNAQGNVVVDGTEVTPELLTGELVNLLAAAAAVDEPACLIVRVADNEVFVDVNVQGCVTLAFNNDGTISADFGGVEVVLPADVIVDPVGELEDGDPVALDIVAQLAVETGELRLQAGIPSDSSLCGRGGPGQVVIDKAVDADGDRGTFGDLEDGGPGWTFDFAISDGDVLDEFPTTNEESDAYFSYTTEGPAPVITVTEQLPEGWTVLEAACVDATNGEPIGEWSGTAVTFTAEREGDYTCFFVNSPTGAEPTRAPTAAPTTDQAPATERPTITQPPTDGVGAALSERRTSPAVAVAILLAIVVTLALVSQNLRRRGRAFRPGRKPPQAES